MNPFLALIIANIIWGMASPIFKFALTNIPPFTLAFIRFFFAGLIFLPLAIKNWQKLTAKQFFEILLVGFFGITINISFFFLGVVKTESINVPIIASSGPVFIYLLSILFLREKPKLKVLTGMLIALAGVSFIILSPLMKRAMLLLSLLRVKRTVKCPNTLLVVQPIIGFASLKAIALVLALEVMKLKI